MLFLSDQQAARVKIYVNVIPNLLNFNILHRIGFVIQMQYYYVMLSALIRRNILIIRSPISETQEQFFYL
jgi:hypothetical protein